MDSRYGRWGAISLGEYLVPVNADAPEITIEFVEVQDSGINPLGVKGVGEIGQVGTAAAIANAVFNATGRRIRELPIAAELVMDPEPPSPLMRSRDHWHSPGRRPADDSCGGARLRRSARSPTDLGASRAPRARGPCVRSANAPRGNLRSASPVSCWSCRSLFCSASVPAAFSPHCGFSGRSRPSPASRRDDRVLVGRLARDAAPRTAIRDPGHGPRHRRRRRAHAARPARGRPPQSRRCVRRHARTAKLADVSCNDAARWRLLRRDAATDSRRRGMAASPPRPYRLRPNRGCGCMGHRAHALPAVGTNSSEAR